MPPKYNYDTITMDYNKNITLEGTLIGTSITPIDDLRKIWLETGSSMSINADGVEYKTIKGPLKTSKYPSVKRVIFNPPAVIVLWDDDSKTIVKTQKGEEYDAEKGLAMCFMRKFLSPREYHEKLEEAHEFEYEYLKSENMFDKLPKAMYDVGFNAGSKSPQK